MLLKFTSSGFEGPDALCFQGFRVLGYSSSWILGLRFLEAWGFCT